MDGGEQQATMAQKIRDSVKDGAQKRREKRKVDALKEGEGQFAFDLQDPQPSTSEKSLTTRHSSSQAGPSAKIAKAKGSTTVPPLSQLPADRPPFAAHRNGGEYMVLDIISYFTQPGSHNESVFPDELPSSQNRIWEAEVTMTYLDHVFPFLFPFYKPGLFSTSRAWLLTLLKPSTAVYHSALSLSAFFLTVNIRHRNRKTSQKQQAVALCRTMVWDKVAAQLDRSSLRILQDLNAFQSSKEGKSLLEKVRMMEAITQTLIFDTFLGRCTSWRSHLTPATKLLEEVLQEYGTGKHDHSSNGNGGGHRDPGSSENPFEAVLHALAWEEPAEAGKDPRLWNPDQAAFRFFTAVVIFVEIVACTSLGREPRLRKYYGSIIGDLALDDIGAPLDLFAFLGCKNWVFLALSEAANLCAWKNSKYLMGLLSRDELRRRAEVILDALKSGLAELNTSTDPDAGEGNGYQLQLPWSPKSQGSSKEREKQNAPSKIWAYATRIYVTISVEGWSARSSKLVVSDAASIITSLRLLETTAEFHTFAWPICVVGCVLRDPAERQAFSDMVTEAGDKQLLASVRESQSIMKAVWSKAEDEMEEDWDLMDCFDVFESPVLLI